MNRVIIVVPQYKPELTSMETFALNQLEKILGGGGKNKYAISFVCPQYIKDIIAKKHPNHSVEAFDNDFFLNTKTYNKLCFSQVFYERFSEYEYMLICHLDAFVFSDRLTEFLDMNYDYIGAPWPVPLVRGGKRLYVGNGGFSLRRVQAFIDAIENYGDWMNVWYENEDCFFAYLGKVRNSNFRVAPLSVAINFSWETYPERNYKKTKKLPFACHGFHKWNPRFYLNLFLNLGYDVKGFMNENIGENEAVIPLRYVDYALKRLQKSIYNGDSIKKYLPQVNAPILCCMFSVDAMLILQALYNEGYPIANPDNIIMYDKSQNMQTLVSDFKNADTGKLIVTLESDTRLVELLAQHDIVYGKDYISFWSEYFKYELNLLRKIVSPKSTDRCDDEIQYSV